MATKDADRDGQNQSIATGGFDPRTMFKTYREDMPYMRDTSRSNRPDEKSENNRANQKRRGRR